MESAVCPPIQSALTCLPCFLALTGSLITQVFYGHQKLRSSNLLSSQSGNYQPLGTQIPTTSSCGLPFGSSGLLHGPVDEHLILLQTHSKQTIASKKGI